ncbi:MAG: hypothetical protein Q7T58_07035 [Methylotenera sp.]|nr:hypothetical protein [Methylotenera sp.]
MIFSELRKFLIEKLIEWKFQAWSLLIVSTIVGGLRVFEKRLIELIPIQKELIALRSLELNILLLVVMTISYFWFHKNYVNKKPVFSKVTDIQKQILKSLESENSPSWIANNTEQKEHFVIRQLEILESYLLVSHSSVQFNMWFLTKHGRAYLYP